MADAGGQDALGTYRKKRDFARTPEPAGDPKPAAVGELRFVVQKHAARRLHYDFRLELDGVLKSWAVPKGPSLDPSQRRLAMRTEDHPLEYASFEGVIPEGEYGAGAVIVWDQGLWEPEEDAEAGFAKGRIKFRLSGEKLKGSWRLIRTGDAARGKEQWLLIKSKDEAAAKETDIVTERPESALSGRSLEQVAEDPDRLWRSERDFARKLAPDVSTLRGAKRKKVEKIRWPEVEEGEHVPDGDEWLHEIGHAGVRVAARVTNDQVEILDDAGEELTDRLPQLARTLGALPLGEVLILGVVTKLSRRGIGEREPVTAAIEAGQDDDLVLMAFDLLALDQFDLRGVSLQERKRALMERLRSAGAVGTRIRWVDHVMGRGGSVEEHACEIGARTIVSKRTEDPAGAPFRLTRCRSGVEPLDVELAPAAKAALAATRFTHPDKVLFPGQGITKLELATFYAAVGDFMMPHVKGRLLTLYRCPEGQGGQCFYQKHERPGMPKSLRRVKVVESDEAGIYLVADDLQGLLGLVQIGVLEIHGWMSRDDTIEQPDRMIFDLDPDSAVPWPEITRAARDVRARLKELGLESFVSTTGKKGLHVVVPLRPNADYEQVKSFSRTVAQQMATESPKRFVAVQTKAKRAGKIYLDYLRNGRGSSAIVPYSTRAAPGAPVATPLRWEELDRLVGADAFTLRTLPHRLAKVGDAWEGFFEIEQEIEP